MKICPNCKKSVSDYAVECPHCKAILNEPITEQSSKVAEKKFHNRVDIPLTGLIPIVCILSLLAVIIPILFRTIEINMCGQIMGSEAMEGIDIALRCCKIWIAIVIQMILLSCVSVVFNKLGDKITKIEFPLIGVAVINFLIMVIVMTVTQQSPTFYANDGMWKVYANEVLNQLPIFYGIIFTSFTLCGCYAFMKFGIKGGIVRTVILAIIEAVVIIVRVPLLVGVFCTGTKLLYSFIIALLIAALQVLVLFIGNRVKR